MCNNTTCSDNGTFTDCHATQNSGIASNRCPTLNYGWNDMPVCFTLQSTLNICRTRIFIVNKHHTMTDKCLVFYRYPFTNKCVALNFDSFSNSHAFLDLDKGPDFGVIANLTTIEIDKGIDFHITPNFDIRCDHLIVAIHDVTFSLIPPFKSDV